MLGVPQKSRIVCLITNKRLVELQILFCVDINPLIQNMITSLLKSDIN